MHEAETTAPRAGNIGPIRREIVFEPLPESSPEPVRPVERPPAQPAAPREPVPATT